LSLNSLPFRMKVALLLAGVILLLGVIAVTYARNDIRRILGTELERRGEAIARNLASNSIDPLLTDDLYALYELVNRTKVSDADIRYILIINPEGAVRVSTFGSDAIPHGLLAANMPQPARDSQLRRLWTEEGLVRDISVPILQSKAGIVRVGMSDLTIEAMVLRDTKSLSIMAALSAILGFAISYLLADYLTRPLRQLLQAVQSVASGNLSQRITSPGKDEVGQLEKAFNTMTEALTKNEKARRDLLKKVISSQEEERRRIARELHDELAQQLTSVILSLETVENKLAESGNTEKQIILRAKQVVQGSLMETRKLIGDLRPSVLDDLGLVPALRSYAETRLHPLQCKVSLATTGLPSSLPFTLETTAYRIAQEAINNIAKHAHASLTTISLRLDNGVFHGNIGDDGKGFQVTQCEPVTPSIAGGLGLQGMRERASLLGGVLYVQSIVGQGTSVSFSIPMFTEDKNDRRENPTITGR